MASEVRLAVAVPSRRNQVIPLLHAMRPQQWAKNFVVVLAPIFGMRFDVHTLAVVSAAFVAFCAASSGIYLINDVVDAPKDRLHPTKSLRPVAAGTISTSVALSTAVGLLSAALLISFAVSILLAAVILTYLVIQTAYALALKSEPILDIICISMGFVLRALAGAAAALVAPSGWFLLCIALLALFLAIEKRKAELRFVADGGGTRTVLKAYSLPLLLRMESVATGGALISYGLWAVERTAGYWMLATLPPVIYGLLRYQLLTERGEGEAPEKALLASPHIMIAAAIWLLSSVSILLLETHRELLPHF
jgi:decaprenyl-phosphate phosphoribosyltransferase